MDFMLITDKIIFFYKKNMKKGKYVIFFYVLCSTFLKGILFD